jgi:hypothetical protein
MATTAPSSVPVPASEPPCGFDGELGVPGVIDVGELLGEDEPEVDGELLGEEEQ